MSTIENLPVATRIMAGLNTLGTAERAVAQALLANTARVPELSTQAVAELAGASRATVVRACQALGYTGYQQVRILLARDNALSGGTGPDFPTGEIKSVMASLVQGLEYSMTLLDEDALRATIDDLTRARRILVVASGLSAPVGNALLSRLVRLRLDAVRLADAVDTEIAADSLTPDDVCVVVSATGANADSLRSARRAAGRGATVVGLTAFGGTALESFATRVHVTATADRRFEDELRLPSRLAQHVLVEALVIALEQRLLDAGSNSSAQTLEVISDHVDE